MKEHRLNFTGSIVFRTRAINRYAPNKITTVLLVMRLRPVRQDESTDTTRTEGHTFFDARASCGGVLHCPPSIHPRDVVSWVLRSVVAAHRFSEEGCRKVRRIATLFEDCQHYNAEGKMSNDIAQGPRGESLELQE